jgi:hypothetical protein
MWSYAMPKSMSFMKHVLLPVRVGKLLLVLMHSIVKFFIVIKHMAISIFVLNLFISLRTRLYYIIQSLVSLLLGERLKIQPNTSHIWIINSWQLQYYWHSIFHITKIHISLQTGTSIRTKAGWQAHITYTHTSIIVIVCIRTVRSIGFFCWKEHRSLSYHTHREE